jgi:hypothetical protein
LLAIDSALELAGMDRAWLHSRCSRLRRRTPLERIQAGAADEVLRVLQHSACKLGHPLPYEGAEDLMPGAYSTDLRERVLVAIEAGEAADVVAEQFMVRNLYAK